MLKYRHNLSVNIIATDISFNMSLKTLNLVKDWRIYENIGEILAWRSVIVVNLVKIL